MELVELLLGDGEDKLNNVLLEAELLKERHGPVLKYSGIDTRDVERRRDKTKGLDVPDWVTHWVGVQDGVADRSKRVGGDSSTVGDVVLESGRRCRES